MPRRIGFHVCTCLRENNYSTHFEGTESTVRRIVRLLGLEHNVSLQSRKPSGQEGM